MFRRSATKRTLLLLAPQQPRIARRPLSLHEHVAMDLLRKHGVPIPRGAVARSPGEAYHAAKGLGTAEVIVKAQVLAGGRGKGKFGNGYQGGVQLCKSSAGVETVASKMIGQRLYTKQTGPAGKPCNSVYVCERLFPTREYYFAILFDRKAQGPVLVGSNQGGMDIEAVAEATPDAIHSYPVDISRGLSLPESERFAASMGFTGDNIAKAAGVMMRLYVLFLEKDATLLEINPLAEERGGAVICMDAKLNVDDNADFRQPELFSLRDATQEDPREVLAAEAKLNYIGLNGSIGCLVNGAGLAMATMDIIKLHGGEPANFLDVGGSATVQQVTDAFKIISGDPKVSAILVNIFGGIMRCDVIAQGVIEACKTLDLRIPLIVRLQGTKVTEARKLIKESNLRIIAEDDLDKAAKAAVAFASQSATATSI